MNPQQFISFPTINNAINAINVLKSEHVEPLLHPLFESEEPDREVEQCPYDESYFRAKRRRMNRFVPPPRVFRCDIRRRFPSMMINIFNSYNPKLLLSFLKRFSPPNLTLKKMLYLPSLGSFGLMPVNLHFKSFRKISSYFGALVRLCPDQTFKIVAAQVMIRSDQSGSKVNFVVETSGTKIYSHTPIDIKDALETILTSETQTSRSNIFDDKKASPSHLPSEEIPSNIVLNYLQTNQSNSLTDPFQTPISNLGNILPLTPGPPEIIQKEFLFTLHLNDNKEIVCIQLQELLRNSQ